MRLILSLTIWLLDRVLERMASGELHLTRIENEVIKGRASVLKGLELLKFRVGK